MKKLSKFIVLALIALALPQSVYAKEGPKVLVNSEEIKGQAVYKESYHIYADHTDVKYRVLVPLREIFESLDARVHYDHKTKIIRGEKEGKIITLTIGRTITKVGEKSISIDEPASIINLFTICL